MSLVMIIVLGINSLCNWIGNISKD